MGQIVKKKKKGRPSKADLARRGISPLTATESEPRRSLRRRNVRYNIDYDDYLDEDFEEDEEEDERGREKKLKLVVKLNQSREVAAAEATLQSGGRGAARGSNASKDEEEEEEEEEDEEEFERKKVKKRRINGGDEDDDDVDDEDDDGRAGAEGRGRKGESKGNDSVPGTPSDHQIGVPLPDKKTLDLILDKLQKKDTYGVYAEPVDPEELPDYHDVIEHPMDFATVRKKLGNGSYSTLEQFESDVFLICSNAMQYNALDTIYHKQARAIQELATKKFQKLRINVERSEKESKSEQKTKSSFPAKKQMKKPFGRTTQEPVASDFSSGVTLATAGDMQNASITIQPNGCDKPSNTDILVEGHPSLLDNNLEKAEELSSGKGLLPKFGRKSFVLDENRRATYNMSNQPVVRSDSIFTTFEGEIKQLIPVGLQAEYSYARSLARFAATLGPVAWKVASRRIEQAVPAGCKFGRGWVGEYEPLPTPVLMLENCSRKESLMFTKSQHSADLQKENLAHKRPVPAKEKNPVKETVSVSNSSSIRVSSGSSSEGKSSIFASGVSKPGNPVNATYQQKNLSPRMHGEPENKVSKQVELNLPPPPNQTNANVIAKKQSSNKPEMASSSREIVTRSMGPGQSVPSKPVENNGVGNCSLPNGKIPNQVVRAANYFPHAQEQGLSDPIQVMRMLTERAQKQQNSLNQPTADTTPAMPSVPSTKRDDSSSPAAAARGWMSIGAGGFKQVTESSSTPKGQISAESLYNPAREFHPQIQRVRGEFPISAGVQFQSQSQSPKNSFHHQAFAPQPVRLVEAQLQNRPMIFPQIVATDLSRFQVQSPWRGFSPQTQPRQKQESLPPDLNIGFQSPGSPAKQSSGVHVDSQQPDLALQL